VCFTATRMDVSTPRRHPPRNPANQASKHLPDVSSTVPLHSRPTNESWNPQPTIDWSTPQPSPTKGTAQLAELFDRKLHLAPSSQTKPPPSPPPPLPPPPPPSKWPLRNINEEQNGDVTSIIRPEEVRHAVRRNNKENTLSTSPGKEGKKSTALSRSYARSAGKKYDPRNDLSLEDLENLRKPSVKRLKDVAHLCERFAWLRHGPRLTLPRFLRLLLQPGYVRPYSTGPHRAVEVGPSGKTYGADTDGVEALCRTRTGRSEEKTDQVEKR
jgi:hypothetical protein